MKRLILFLWLFIFTLALQALDLKAGIRIGLNNTIGTGKGYWDWTTGMEVKRQMQSSYILTGLLHWQFEPILALEGGITYADNICIAKVDQEEYLFTQKSIELPLTLKIYYSQEPKRLYLKGGVALIILDEEASFINQHSGENLFLSPKAANRFHGGLNLGFGVEIQSRKKHLYFVEFLYSTFYTSPEYLRIDGTRGNIRFHRFELGLGMLF